jgi:hypothetical protein
MSNCCPAFFSVNISPLDAKTVEKIKKKYTCWTRYRETGDKKNTRNTPKQEIKLKAHQW